MLFKTKGKALEEITHSDIEVLRKISSSHFVGFIKLHLSGILPDWEGSVQVAIEDYEDNVHVFIADNSKLELTIITHYKADRNSFEVKHITLNELLPIVEMMGFVKLS